jgi:signal transduction histidine kinase
VADARKKQQVVGLAKLGSVGLAAAVAHEVRRLLTPAKVHAERAATSSGLCAEASLSLILLIRAAAEVEQVLDLLVGSQVPQDIRIMNAAQSCLGDDPQVRVHGDANAMATFPEAALSVVLHNLVHNAKRACPDGSPIDVTVGVDSTGNTSIQVEDSGSGLKHPSPFRLFDPSASGSGIGLPLCRALVEEYGGTIEVRPRAIGGTTALVWLPAASIAKREAA